MDTKRTNKIHKITMSSLIGLFLMSGVFDATASAKQKVVFKKRPVVVVQTGRQHFWHRRFDPVWTPSVTYRSFNPVHTLSEEGFGDGRNQGRRDAKKGLEMDPTGNKHHLKSNSFAYRRAYIRGYEHGYRSEKN
ncbi:MAG: hypothetical protein ABI882_24105 [Acidobacteriota bacterium]